MTTTPIDYRVPKYLSFSGMTQFLSDRDEYFLKYIAKNRPERSPQSAPASVGSSFDARVKAELYERYYGKGYMPEKYSFEALFEKQVEAHQRDFALGAGMHVYDCYQKSGMYDRFAEVMDLSVIPPQFEFRVEAEIEGVPLLGLPDGYGKTANGTDIIGDWKVNGYCSNSNTSPNKGYLMCLDGYESTKPSRSHGKSHRDCVVKLVDGIEVSEQAMEDYQDKWASQTIGYAWCLGLPVGSEDAIVMIHQCVAKPLPSGGKPLLRFAEFRGHCRTPFQEMLVRKYQRVWKAVSSGHVYDEMSREDSDKAMEKMHSVAEAVHTDTDEEHAAFYSNVIRPDWRG